MTYKAIATVLFDQAEPSSGLETAIDLAREWNAHLHVLCMGIDHTEPGFYYAGAQAIAVQENLERARHAAQEMEKTARARLEREEVSWDVQAETLATGGLRLFLADYLRFFDLIVLPTPYAQDSPYMAVEIFETCLFGASRPVLVLPREGVVTTRYETIMMAWDDGPEGLSACRAALPMIAAASRTHVAIIDPPAHAPDRSDPGGRLAHYLARQGGKVEVSVTARSQTSIALQLLQMATEREAGLIVMGGYGHSRLREALLGGATRDMLKMTRLPVLMAR